MFMCLYSVKVELYTLNKIHEICIKLYYKINEPIIATDTSMASRFTIYSNKQISYIVYKISSLINKISTLFY